MKGFEKKPFTGIREQIIRRLKYRSIKRSLKELFVLAWVLPFVIVSIFFIYLIYNYMFSLEMKNIGISLSHTKEYFDKSLSSVKSFSDRIYVNKKIHEVLQKTYSNNQEVFYDYTGLSFLDDYLRSCDEVSSFRIYTENLSLLDNSFIIKVRPEVSSQNWYRKAVELKGQNFWVYIADAVTKKNYLCLVRSMWSQNMEKLHGILVVNVSNQHMQNILMNQTYDTVIAFENEILYSTVPDVTEKEREVLFSLPVERRIHITKWRERNYNGVFLSNFAPAFSNSPEFNAAFLVPMNQLFGITLSAVAVSAALLLLIAFLSASVISIYSAYTAGRVSKIKDGITNVVADNFEIDPSIGGNDEYEQIYRTLYKMSGNIKSLIEQVYLQNIEKERMTARQNEINFKMLSTQINPHFLFNTLETIRMKSAVNAGSASNDVSVMLKLLASLLRYNLSVSGRPVCFFDELNAVQNYLNIQHFRFGNRISYDVIPLCDIRRIIILPLLIQPLVENSFSHGLEDTAEGGFIYITAQTKKNETEELLYITIKDNGKGITPEKLSEIQAKLEKLTVPENEPVSNAVYNTSVQKASIGMVNVNSRIKLFYGQQYGLSVKSKEGEGTEVTIVVPVIYTNNIMPKV